MTMRYHIALHEYVIHAYILYIHTCIHMLHICLHWYLAIVEDYTQQDLLKCMEGNKHGRPIISDPRSHEANLHPGKTEGWNHKMKVWNMILPWKINVMSYEPKNG